MLAEAKLSVDHSTGADFTVSHRTIYIYIYTFLENLIQSHFYKVEKISLRGMLAGTYGPGRVIKVIFVPLRAVCLQTNCVTRPT